MIDLITNTGVQFYTVPAQKARALLTAQAASLPLKEVVRTAPNGASVCSLHFPIMNPRDGNFYDQSAIPARAWNDRGELDWAEVDVARLLTFDGIDYSASMKDALDLFSNRWLPLPYFKRQRGGGQPFDFGPHAWARMWVGYDAQVSTLDLVLAFDTTIGENDPTYTRLRPVDATSEGQSIFGCACDVQDMHGFYELDWVSSWLEFEFKRKREARPQFKREHVSHYLAFLRMLGKAQTLPDVQLFDKEEEIEASLILDIGNARTCGVIAETSSLRGQVQMGEQHLDRLRKLELRNLSHPTQVESEPFDMRMTFHEQCFGNEMGKFIGPAVFQWPSMVRLGNEAKELSRGFDLVGGRASMSSPKRYLWDLHSATMPWCKVLEDSETAASNAEALFGLALELNNEGNLLSKDEFGFINSVVNSNRYRAQQDRFGEPQAATKARFSRGNLMALAVAELLSQATSQMNSFAFRDFQGDRPYRRRLKYVVVTCPTAMPKAEQIRLREAVEDAVVMLRRTGMGAVWHKDLEVIPSPTELRRGAEFEPKHWQFDEATSTQLAFIYSQIAHRLNGNATRFFKAFGKVRITTSGERHSVRVGSIDIGGGTTDMMIAEYFNPSDGTIQSSIKVEPLFWEGFNVAGDDLLKSIIENVVLPCIAASFEKAGVLDVKGLMSMLFSRLGNQSAQHKFMQIQFAQQFLQPVALNLLNSKSITPGLVLRDFLGENPPEREVLEHVKSVIEQIGQVREFDLLDVSLECTASIVEETARVTLDGVLTELSNVVSQFDCDILILTGRPSKLAVVHDMIMSSFPVSPDAIYSLSNYPIGNWYPFTNLNAEITDPKTSVAVGATIGLLGHLNRLPRFQLDDSALRKVESTARYLGVMSDGDAAIKDGKLFFTPEEHAGQIVFAGTPLTLGFRQVNFESWWSTPLYHLSYKNDFAARELARMGIELPITIRVERDPGDPETIRQPITDATDATGQAVPFSQYLNLQLQSLRDEAGYWKDTGLFTIL